MPATFPTEPTDPSRYAASVRHLANVVRALARHLEASDAAALADAGLTAPLDHPSARDAVTLLDWHGPTAIPTLGWAMELSQSATVRLVDRLCDAGLVRRRRERGDRRVWLELTPEGERAAAQVRSTRADPLQELARQAFPDLAAAQAAVTVLDRLAAVAVGPDLDAARFCRGCDVESCLADGQPCPSARRCAANAAATT